MNSFITNQPVARLLFFFATVALYIMVPCESAIATPSAVPLNLKRTASSIRFGVESPSPTLQMNGSFTKFEGSLFLDPVDVTQSSVKLVLDLTSVQLTPDQIIQSIFVQTALAHLRQQKTSFISETIQRVKGQSFLITGMYTWQGKSKRTTVPVEIVHASPSLSEIRLLLNGKAKDGDSPAELSQLGGLSAAGSKGWAKGTFVFTNNR